MKKVALNQDLWLKVECLGLDLGLRGLESWVSRFWFWGFGFPFAVGFFTGPFCPRAPLQADSAW